MGRIRDEIYETMWDSVSCKKHSWTGPDSRFTCPKCDKEREQIFLERQEKAIQILMPHGLSDMVRYT